MKQTVYLGDFRDAFHKMGRGEQFSYEGLGILFNWIEQLDDDTGEETELDVIALCCDFAEMTLEELIKAYDLEDDTTLDEAYQWIAEQTLLCGKTDQDTFVFQQF
jgi:hypothetical protein